MYSIARGIIGLVLGFAAVTASANDVVLFECQLEEGGVAVASRHGKDVNLHVVHLGKTTDVTNPADETGVGHTRALDNTPFDFLDLLSGDMQYSVMVRHTDVGLISSVIIYNDAAKESEWFCLRDTVKSNLHDHNATKGIFRP